MNQPLKKWLNTKGLKFKLWSYFVLFSAVIMIVLWLLQIIFLGTFYQTMKLHQVEHIGSRIIAAFGSENFDETVFDISFRNGILVRLFDENGQYINSGGDIFSDFKQPRLSPEDVLLIRERINQSKNGRVSFTTDTNDKNRHMRPQAAVFAARLLSQADGNTIYMYINAPLMPVDATTQVLQNQLIIVTALSLLFGFILSYFIARKMSSPLTRLTNSAKQLATGDYSVVFDEGGYAEIDELAAALNYTTKELSKTDALRRDLVANVSHDLRTPLTIIKSYAEMIRDLSGGNPEKRTLHTQVIIDESDRLSALVSDLLDLSKMEAGVLTLHPTRFDLSEAAARVMERFRVLSESEGYQFDLQCQSGAAVYADEQRIEQVIYNLLGNAVNYTGADKRITVRVAALPGGGARFAVTDTGSGISKEEIGQIWDRYYKASQTSRRTAKGTGIGLAIVKNILDAHHAQYGVESVTAQQATGTTPSGSTFWFVLQ